MRTLLMALALWLCMPASAQAEDWVAAGWQEIAARHEKKALIIWQQGIDQLDDHRLLASIGVYAHFPYAVAQLKRVGLAFDALIARHDQHDRTLYFVLSARRTPADKLLRQTVMADLKQAAGISDILIAATAGTFKKQTASTVAPVLKQAMPTTMGMATAGASFSINRFEISGNQHLSTDIILMGLRDFYGADKTPADLQAIQAQIIEIYRMSNIYNVQVSNPQRVDDTVRLTIRE